MKKYLNIISIISLAISSIIKYIALPIIVPIPKIAGPIGIFMRYSKSLSNEKRALIDNLSFLIQFFIAIGLLTFIFSFIKKEKMDIWFILNIIILFFSLPLIFMFLISLKYMFFYI